ncbi:MAG: hypothetical protein DYG93_08385 [Leptolyngbya sp. PLA2]|nr:hypothetical protein [Leptolyngbya sp.]MCE7971664.1 hypothetical protein [Leptolyngbya sp. PL-A2]MCQ3940019.1 hypothetical protein [cyanobacterium CYA1]MCZ7633625.1 hypothetical protein [Phycisphaerales bacterium]MDL1903239.1 hypothetical protein [Synechococcales cyanobacterium CNB]GIK17939.1 MAG: hypothetical protein BroJett004_01030 [Planctomycetota bacterium]
MTTDLHNRTKRSRGGRRSRARLLKAISGLPAGAAPSRRGSFLIMVVGVLALLAVVTVLYAAIGRSDRQVSAAVVKNDERHSVPEQVRDYLAGVIAADTFSTYFAGEYGENGAPLQRREAWDYPSSPYFVTNPNTGAVVPVTTQNFSPTGLINLSGVLVGTGTDPWLAASEPTYLNFGKNSYTATEEYQRQIDWAHISNFAPDGAFVNLYNLRRGGGNFAATPWEMRRDLRLWDSGPNANPTATLDFGGTAQDSDTFSHRPAEWTARQRAAFRVPRHPVGSVNSYNHIAFPLYQWADADGDGILDSRWFELVEARHPNQPEQWRSFLSDRRYRYFIAARAIDLSGRINVNTATDLADAPSRSNMLGLTPSDADLFAFLTMENAALNAGSALTYDRLEQPKQANQPGDYSSLDDPVFMYDMGRYGYNALRQTLFAGLVPPANWNGTNGWEVNDVKRTKYYRDFAGLGMDAAGHDSGAMHTIAAPFNLADLYELLVYNGVNDPATRSRLESAVGGRFLSGGQPYSPLRDNRPLALERGGIDNDAINDGPNGFLDNDALVQVSIDPRRRLTTISAARPILSRLGVTPNTPISTTDLRASTESLFPGGVPSVDTLFQHYADALLPYSYLSAAWSGTAGYSTLFYGHRGPELALRIAAHMAVNMADAYDEDDSPTVRTLLVDASVRQQIIDDVSGNYSPNLLDLGDARLAQGEPVSSQAINVFGIEVQPFLTEAASFAVYTDTPRLLGGDDDTGERTIGDGNSQVKVYTRDPSIDGRVLESNPDFLFEVIAFQVHNPFDRAVTLPDTGGSFYVQYGDDYYKLVSGAYGGGATSVTIAPRETQVFYTLSNGITEIATRIANITGNPVPTEEATVQDWLDTQLGVAAIRVAPADIDTGTLDTSNAFRNLQNGTDESRRVVRLWRNSGGTSPTRILVDRLRDPAPGGVTLDRQLSGHGPGAQGGVSGAQRGPEPPDPNASPDNSGLSITRHASIRRKDDPRGGTTSDPPPSVLPAYCIESKWQGSLQNATQTDGTGSRLTIGDFTGTKGDKTLNGLLNKQAGLAAQALLPTIKQGPDDKSGQSIGANIAGRTLDGSLPGETPLYAVPSLDNRKFEETGGVSRMRVADLLLPLGIGPTFDPAEADQQDQWTTLSEALAIALYYENPPAGDFYHNAFSMGVGLALGPALEAGQLVLDDFVPFFDANNDGLFDAASDQRWGLGVPMAMTVLDRFTTMPRRFGSTSVGTFGVINVNTAPLAVLRAIPMFSPAAPDPGGGSWWWFGSGHDETSDIAATVYAYRDRLAIYPRDFAAVPVNLLNFRDGSSGLPGGSPPGYDPADDGRLTATGIPAIREMPGLLTPGELLAARDTQYPDAAFPHDIDRLGFNGQNVAHEGLESVRYGTGGTDDLADDWAERLVIANAAMSSVSVRSDVFAVWFVLHGYQESDVKGLATDQPMTPSIARRFLMVVDRSNVVRPSDKPRILLFKEVPL